MTSPDIKPIAQFAGTALPPQARANIAALLRFNARIRRRRVIQYFGIEAVSRHLNHGLPPNGRIWTELFDRDGT
jgi:hypothetical protein